MHRFYLPPSECRASPLSLTGREAHHALHVLRVRTSDSVTVLNGEGGVILCKIASTKRDHVSLEILEQRSVPPLPYHVTLAQGIPKGKLFEAIVQKATELGAARIVPLLTERVVSKPAPEDGGHKVEKWRQVAIEAIKQCGSGWLPKIETPVTVDEFLSLQAETELALVGSLAQGSQHPRNWFMEFAQAKGRNPKSVSVAIGPEGDFTAEELSVLQSAGAKPITLGPLVLRTETAAIYCLSVINYELQFGAAG
jgi:16S rRNA (uracil1498-N3)-methyltransferase